MELNTCKMIFMIVLITIFFVGSTLTENISAQESDEEPIEYSVATSLVSIGEIDKKIDNSYVYLVHSYYVPIIKSTISVTEYGLKYSSAIQKDNFFGVQFHPEKSSKVGNSILKNFLDL